MSSSPSHVCAAAFWCCMQLASRLAGQGEAAPAPSILERHRDFVGGAPAIAAAGDFVLEGTVEAGGEPLVLRTFVRRTPFALRQEIRSQQQALPPLVRITDGRYAWQLDAEGRSEPLPPVAARLLMEAAFLDGLLYLDPASSALPITGGLVTLLGMGPLPGGLGAAGRLRDVQFAPAGADVHFLFDEANGALRAVIASTTAPARELRLGNWQEHGGLRWPMLRWEFTDGVAATVTIDTVRVGMQHDPALFGGSPAPELPKHLRVGELWMLPDSVPEAMQFAVPHVGIGNGLEVVALFDTGANDLYLAEAAADRAGLPALKRGHALGTNGLAAFTERWLDLLQLGTFVDRQLRVHATVMPSITALAVQHQPAMVLGTEVAVDRSPILDLGNGHLSLRGTPVTPLGDGERTGRTPLRVPFRRDPRSSLPMVEVKLGDATIDALFDTGQAPVLMLTTSGLARAGLPVTRDAWIQRGAIAMPMQGAGGLVAEQLLVRLPSVRLGSVQWQEPWVLVSLASGVAPFEAALGGGALWHFARVGIDAEHNLLELEPRDSVARTGDQVVVPRSASFAGIVPVPAQLGAVGRDAMPIVHVVFPGTIAAAAGVREGDRIHTIDGHRCAGLAPRSFNERLWIREKAVRLEVVRKDGTPMLLQLMPTAAGR